MSGSTSNYSNSLFMPWLNGSAAQPNALLDPTQQAQLAGMQANFPTSAPTSFDDQAGLRQLLEQLGGNQTGAATPGAPGQPTAPGQMPTPIQTTSPVLSAYGPAMATLSQAFGVPIGGAQGYPGAQNTGGQGLMQWLGQQFDQGPNLGNAGRG